MINVAAAGKLTHTEELVKDMRYDSPMTHIARKTIRFLASSARSLAVTCLDELILPNHLDATNLINRRRAKSRTESINASKQNRLRLISTTNHNETHAKGLERLRNRAIHEQDRAMRRPEPATRARARSRRRSAINSTPRRSSADTVPREIRRPNRKNKKNSGVEARRLDSHFHRRSPQENSHPEPPPETARRSDEFPSRIAQCATGGTKKGRSAAEASNNGRRNTEAKEGSREMRRRKATAATTTRRLKGRGGEGERLLGQELESESHEID